MLTGVLIAIVLGIALVIGVLIVTVGVVCLKRYASWLSVGSLTHTTSVLHIGYI